MGLRIELVSPPAPALLRKTLLVTALSLSTGALATASPLVHVPGDTANLQTAINQVDDGGVIEIAGGTYAAPAGGFVMNDLGKGFTVRAAAGATVVIDGGGTTVIFRFQNSDPSKGKPIVFEDLTFANGYSDVEGLAGAISLYTAEGTFVDCTFQDNRSVTTTTVGGAVYVASSTAFFVNTLWTRNESSFGGAGLGARSNARIFVHRSQFLDNRANPPGHVSVASGGAINVGDTALRVTDTRFESNQAGAFGGALYGIGTWAEPLSEPQADIIVANSTFVNNQAIRDPSVSASFKTEGGAINVEDQTTLRVFNSRFVGNRAIIGGGVNIYRAEVTIRESVFQGNQAYDPDNHSGFGGAISAASGDQGGEENRRSAILTVENTFIQGRHGAVQEVAPSGGGIYVSGDVGRIDGDPAVPDMGTVAENRAQLVIRGVVLFDCDVTAPSGLSLGGGVVAQLADLTLEDSQILASDAGVVGSTSGAGGGLAVLLASAANVTRTTFARNTATQWGGALFAQGSTLTVSDSQFFENENTDFGAAIFTGPDVGRDFLMDGTVSGSVFSNNTTLDIFDDDRSTGPINDVQYNSNEFFRNVSTSNAYRNSITGVHTVAALNDLVVTRNSGVPSTDKSTQVNTELTDAAVLGAITAVPTSILSRGAEGDPSGSTTAYLGYSWSGGEATLDGAPVSGHAGVTSAAAGTHTLSVAGQPFTATVADGAQPSLFASASPPSIASGESSTLDWTTVEGSFLALGGDQGLALPSQPSGEALVTPLTSTTYRLVLVTQEGGAISEVTIFVDENLGLIFADGFESQSTDAWSETVDPGSSLSVLSSAASSGTYGASLSLEGCSLPSNIVLTGGTVTTDQEACDSITASDVEVPGGAGVAFRAGRRIVLGSGFSVAEGGSFTAAIDRSVSGDAFLVDHSPSSEVRYIAAFDLDLTDLSLPSSDRFDHFVGYRASGEAEFRLILKRNDTIGENRLVVEVREDGGQLSSTESTNELAVADGYRTLDIDWVRSSGSDDGSVIVCVEDTENTRVCASLSGLNNDESQIDTVRWGAQGVDQNTGGSLKVDAFESRRF